MNVINALTAALPAFVAVFLAVFYFAEFRWGSAAGTRRENIIFAAVIAGVAAAFAVMWVAADKVQDARRAGSTRLGVYRVTGIDSAAAKQTTF